MVVWTLCGPPYAVRLDGVAFAQWNEFEVKDRDIELDLIPYVGQFELANVHVEGW